MPVSLKRQCIHPKDIYPAWTQNWTLHQMFLSFFWKQGMSTGHICSRQTTNLEKVDTKSKLVTKVHVTRDIVLQQPLLSMFISIGHKFNLLNCPKWLTLFFPVLCKKVINDHSCLFWRWSRIQHHGQRAARHQTTVFRKGLQKVSKIKINLIFWHW